MKSFNGYCMEKLARAANLYIIFQRDILDICHTGRIKDIESHFKAITKDIYLGKYMRIKDFALN